MMIQIKKRNGSLSLFKGSAVREYDGHVFRKHDQVFPNFPSLTYGYIEKFELVGSYIYARVNGRLYSLEELHYA